MSRYGLPDLYSKELDKVVGTYKTNVNGETTQVSFYNKLIELPKTGDNSHIARFAGAIFFAILGIIYLIIKIFKGKK